MTVRDIIQACEYTDCDIYNQLGEEYEINKNNCTEIYDLGVEHIEVENDGVIIYTFEKLDELCNNLIRKDKLNNE